MGRAPGQGRAAGFPGLPGDLRGEAGDGRLGPIEDALGLRAGVGEQGLGSIAGLALDLCRLLLGGVDRGRDLTENLFAR